MRKTIIADSSCLIILTNIGQLDILRAVYGVITLTPEVAQEYRSDLPDWMEVLQVKDLEMLEKLNEEVDLGEASAIALAMETDDHLLIIDDKAGRDLAASVGLEHIGTLGVLTKAKKEGALKEVGPIVQALRQAGFRMSEALMKAVLSVNGEG